MYFDLNNTWAVESDPLQVCIIKKGTGKKGGKNEGKSVEIDRFYYPDFMKALNGLVDRDIQSLEKIEDVVDRIDQLKQDIKVMLKKVTGAS